MLPVPDIATLQAKVVEIETGYVGEGRYNDPDQITKFLEVEGLPFADENGNPYAFCISGLCFSWMKALAVLMGIPFTPDNIVEVQRSQVRPILVANFFTPSALCTDVIADAQRRGKWLSRDDALAQGATITPGTPVFYEFSPGDHHAETVTEDDGDTFQTIGMNTSCAGHTGMIAAKVRNYDFVLGFYQLLKG